MLRSEYVVRNGDFEVRKSMSQIYLRTYMYLPSLNTIGHRHNAKICLKRAKSTWNSRVLLELS